MLIKYLLYEQKIFLKFLIPFQESLNSVEKNIKKNSSAFWLLPNENQINDDFDESVYELSYTDTINKLRSISEIKLSKYGASIFLAKKIKVSLLSDNQIDEHFSIINEHKTIPYGLLILIVIIILFILIN